MDDFSPRPQGMKWGETALLALLIAGALGVRIWGLEQGYPQFYGHVDEVGVAASIWNFFRSATLLPTEFTYPACYSYLVAVGLWASYWLGLIPDVGDCGDSLALYSFIDPAWSALVGRCLSAGASTLTVLFTYLLGRRACNRGIAAGAALFVAFSTVSVQQAHTALPDSSMALFATICFYASWRIYERGHWFDYGLAGVAAGLVVATKYNGAFTALAIVAAHLVRGGWGGWGRKLTGGRLWMAISLAWAALFVGSPYLFLAHEKYRTLMEYQVSSLGFSLGETSPWWWVVRDLVGGEYAVGLLMVGGIGWVLYRRQPLDYLFLAAWVPSFFYIGSWTRESWHYLLHFYPLLALGGGRLLQGICRRFAVGRKGDWAFWVGVGLLILPNLQQVIQRDRFLARIDTRSMAAAWIEKSIPDGTRLGMTWLPYCPRLSLKVARQSVLARYRGNERALVRLRQAWAGEPTYDLVNLEVWLKRPVVPEAYRKTVDLEDPETRRIFSRGWLSPQQLKQRGVEYIILPEAAYQRYLGEPPSAPEGSAVRYHHLKNRTYFSQLIDPGNPATEWVASFLPGRETRGGGIHIFRLHP
jgi:hypothetical protein